MEFHKIWIEQCEAARGIEVEFGTERALDYLIGESSSISCKPPKPILTIERKSPPSLQTSRRSSSVGNWPSIWRGLGQTGPFDPSVYEDDGFETAEMERQADIRQCAAELWLVERAREWLLADNLSSAFTLLAVNGGFIDSHRKSSTPFPSVLRTYLVATGST